MVLINFWVLFNYIFVLWDNFEIWINLENVVGFVFFNIWCMNFVLNFGILNVFVLYKILFLVIFKFLGVLNICMIFLLFIGIVFGLMFDKFWSIWIIVGLLCLSILSFNILLWIEWKLKCVVIYVEFWLLVGYCIGVKL